MLAMKQCVDILSKWQSRVNKSVSVYLFVLFVENPLSRRHLLSPKRIISSYSGDQCPRIRLIEAGKAMY
jgi:hypothetical protein